jgi:DNA-directed RNA polymerase specialized sigma24 family protein
MTDDKGSAGAICWERVYKKLQRYAFKRTGLSNDIGESGIIEYTIGAGVGPLDLVDKVMSDFLDPDGGVKPDPEKPLTETYLVNLLKKAFRKDYKDLLKSAAVSKEAIRAEDSADGDEDVFDSRHIKKDPVLKEHGFLSDPLPAPDDWAKYQAALRALYEQLSDDEELQQMVWAVCEHDLRWPREIATHLKISVEDINNRQKKLRRRYNHLRPPRRRQRKAV